MPSPWSSPKGARSPKATSAKATHKASFGVVLEEAVAPPEPEPEELQAADLASAAETLETYQIPDFAGDDDPFAEPLTTEAARYLRQEGWTVEELREKGFDYMVLKGSGYEQNTWMCNGVAYTASALVKGDRPSTAVDRSFKGAKSLLTISNLAEHLKRTLSPAYQEQDKSTYALELFEYKAAFKAKASAAPRSSVGRQLSCLLAPPRALRATPRPAPASCSHTPGGDSLSTPALASSQGKAMEGLSSGGVASSDRKSEASEVAGGKELRGGGAEQTAAEVIAESPAAQVQKATRRPPSGGALSSRSSPAAASADAAVAAPLATAAIARCSATNDAISAMLPQWAPDWAPRLLISAATISLVLLCERPPSSAHRAPARRAPSARPPPTRDCAPTKPPALPPSHPADSFHS